MRLRPEQLTAHLEKSSLATVYFLSGDEPLQMLEAEDAIRRRARQEGVDERIVYQVERGFDWDQLAQDGANLSLFSSRRLIELRLGTQKPGKAGGEVLTNWAAKPDNEDILVITGARLDRQAQQARWFKALDKAGVIVQIWPVDATRLPDWIRQRMSAMGRNMDRDAAELIAQRTEGNLLAARQELEKLCLLLDKNDIGLEDVMHHVVDSTRHDVFALIEHVLLGRTRRAAAMLRGMRREGTEPLSLFGALMWEFRRVCSMAARIADGASREQVFKEYRVWQQRQKALGAVLQRFSPREFGHLLSAARDVDRSLKGGGLEDPWTALEDFLFRIAGERLQFQTDV
ncbi:MAG: DNA polymerase III subunit delta [Gammaproteobacteria bacterium]